MAVILYDSAKIESILQHFHTLTGISICLYDSDFNAIAYSGQDSDYCSNIRKNPDRDCQCAFPDKTVAAKCIKEQRFISYTCHAGISETLAPIIYDNIVLGYLLFGGIKDKECNYVNAETIKAACKKYNLDKNEYIGYYRKLKSVDKNTLAACIDILDICIKYIVSEKYIKIDSTIFSSKVISYINEHYTENITLEQLCSVFHVGKNYLYKTLKNQTGQTINNYIISVRLNNAKKYLEQSDKSVTEISWLVGFYDYNYFIRTFKKHFQTTPLKYRNNYKNISSNNENS